ncbi:hypothetical protein ACTHQF_06620 [Pedobacter sp. SAFR-022]|uniref:hypothetical protein n=1 Tax=Pedobacter sp. SAFR-022 TaxID=3436861 RepID=UPI003F7D3D2B
MEMNKKRGRPPGRPKTGGRMPGTPNKITSDLRSRIHDLIDDNWEQMKEDVKVLDAEKRLSFIEKLLKYAVPTLSSVSSEIELKSKLEGMSEDQLNTLITQILDQDEQATN